jgi:hypothetical protein
MGVIFLRTVVELSLQQSRHNVVHHPVLHGSISFGTAAAGRRRAALIVGHVERAVQGHHRG